MEFAVLDFETTGLFPFGVDRVLEVAIVRVNERGELLDEFDTLINPGRDVGPTSIHGIEAWEVADAPPFAEVVGDILAMLDGAIFTAHNARFDARFLDAELQRAGFDSLGLDPLCTMDLLHAVAPGAPRKLSDCCNHFGLGTGTAHQALDDVRMTARLLTYLLDLWQYPALPIPRSFDIKPPRCVRCAHRGSMRPPVERQGDFLAGLVARLPGGAPTLRSSAAGAEYLNLLDRVLEDRRVTQIEAEGLVSLAEIHNLSATEIAALHDDYMRQLVALALEDGVITNSERRDLDSVGILLGAPAWSQYVRQEPRPVAPVANPSPDTAPAQPPPLTGGIAPGMSVCFTGDMDHARTDMQALASAAGLVVKANVSKRLDVLVIADPESQSGKARKAREVGTRLVSEMAFLHMIGAQ